MGLYADSPYWSALLIHIIYSECFPSEPLGLVLMKSFVGSGGPKKYQKCFFFWGGIGLAKILSIRMFFFILKSEITHGHF